MKYYVLLVAMLMLSCSESVREEKAELLPNADPAAFGLDTEEIAAIEDHVQWAIDSQFISGAVALIAKEDKILFHKAFGYSNRDKTDSMRTDHIFRMASMTKPITSTAVMQLVEQGKINLDDPVSKYIPEFSNQSVLTDWNSEDSTYSTVPVKNEMTIHHLLTHTAGFAYSLFHPIAGAVYPPFGVTEAWTRDSVKLSENIPKLGEVPLLHEPGSAWTYGVNIDVLGCIVEVVSGLPLDEYFRENIFEPLGMEDTDFYLPDDKADRLVEVWMTNDMDPEALGTDYPIEGAKSYFAGGAGLVSTSMDYLKFASAILNGGTLGDSQILDPSTVEMMMKNQIDSLRQGPGTGFGYGGSVRLEEDDNGLNPGYWGWDGFWQTRFRIDPQNDLVLILMTNAFGTPKWDQILGGYSNLVVQSIEE